MKPFRQGLLSCLILPGIIGSFFPCGDRLFKPLFGAILAAPFCLLLAFMMPLPERPLFQELAWLFSAIFWCGLGALCHLFVRKLLKRSE